MFPSRSEDDFLKNSRTLKVSTQIQRWLDLHCLQTDVLTHPQCESSSYNAVMQV